VKDLSSQTIEEFLPFDLNDFPIKRVTFSSEAPLEIPPLPTLLGPDSSSTESLSSASQVSPPVVEQVPFPVDVPSSLPAAAQETPPVSTQGNHEYVEIRRGQTGLNGGYWNTASSNSESGSARVLRSSGSRIPVYRPADSNNHLETSENVVVVDCCDVAPQLLSTSADTVSVATESPLNGVKDDNIELDAILFTDDIPKSYQDAIHHPESSGWRAAIHRELQALEQLDTFKVVKRDTVPKDMKVYKTKWVFDRKPPPLLYKARLVFRGDTDKTPLSVQETFSTVVRTENLRLFLTIIISLNWEMVFIDISSAFPNARMKRLLHIQIPQDYPGDLDPREFCLLVQGALYGSPDSSKLWADLFGETIEPLGYERAQSD
jgi:hypothetical protein